MAGGSNSRGQALRRYPALGFVAAAALLATLLPSALRLPLSGPSASAELAPVPGRGEGSGDLASLDASSTGGLGSGEGTGAGGGSADDSPQGFGGGGGGRDPRDKRCVGVPARQTEDPLSPPCVAFFRGDNGGATAKGVTAHEVTMVVVLPCTTDVVADHRDADTGDDAPVIRAYQGFFTERYQMFGRQLRLVLFGFTCNGANRATPARLRALAGEIDSRFAPFAAISLGTPDDSLGPLFEELAKLGIITVLNADRAQASRVAPFIVSYSPDLDERAEIEAAFVCTRLNGHPARLSGNALDRDQTRRFGLVYSVDAPAMVSASVSTEIVAFSRDLFKAALQRRCGLGDIPEATGANPDERTMALQRLRQQGVTTVLFYAHDTDWSFASDGLKWYPEWVISGTAAGVGAARTQAPTVWANAFGVTYDRRRLAMVQQPWYAAYQEGCPGCTAATSGVPGGGASNLYNELTLVMRGVQAAGPRLTPANFDRGLRAIQPNRSPDPFTPATYFSPGTFGFLRDAAVVWWDQSGTPPGERAAGCYRLVDEGARFRAGDWTPGDAGIKSSDTSTQPCHGPIQ